LFALRQAAIEDAPSLAKIDQGPSQEEPINIEQFGPAKIDDAKHFASMVKDFYMTNPVARSSKTMAECSASMSGQSKIAAE